MATAAQYADEVRSLKAQHAPRAIVAAAVETYTILSRKEAAAENLRTLKARNASPEEIREANNVYKSLKELDSAREKVAFLKESRATPSEVSDAVEHFNSLKEKALDPSSISYPPSPDLHSVAAEVETKLPAVTLPPITTTFSSPLSPIPEHGPLQKPVKKRSWTYGLPTSLLIGTGVFAVIAYYWKRIDETYLSNSVVESITTVQSTDEPGRLDAIKMTAANALTGTKVLVHALPPSFVTLSSWASFHLARRLRAHFSLTSRGRGWLVTVPIVSVGIAAGLAASIGILSYTLQKAATQVGLSFARTLLMGARTK